MTSFEQLDEAIDLFKAGRKNAARSMYKSLPDDFRKKVLVYAIAIVQTAQEEIDTLGTYALNSPHGAFVISSASIRDMRDYVPLLGAA